MGTGGARLALGIAVGLAGTACLQPKITECRNGLVCGGDRVCDEVHGLCVVAEQLTVCDGVDDLTECGFGMPSTTGFCTDGVCLPSICGDGVLTGAEECEDGVMPATLCSDDDIGFYDPVPLRCSADCLYDRRACREAGARYCGDGVRDFADGEFCDGSLQSTRESCVSFGYDTGVLGCNPAFCTPGFDNCSTLRWVSESLTEEPFDIWGSGPSDVYAVGKNGLLNHFDGSTWQIQPPPTALDLVSVFGSSPSDVYVAGGDDAVPATSGIVLKYDGTSWTPMTLPANTPMLTGIWIGGGTGFAVGVSGTLLRLTGTTWASMQSPTAASFRGVWGTAANNVFAASDLGVYRFDGSAWTLSIGNVGARAITGLPNGDVIVVGLAFGLGTVLHYTGSVWRTRALPVCTSDLFDVWASSATDVYVTAWGASGKSRSLLHYNGTSFTPLPSPWSIYTRSVWGSAPNDVWLGAPNGLWHGAGHFFVPLPLGPSAMCNNSTAPTTPAATCATDAMVAIAGSSEDDVYAFGDAVCYYNGLNWTQVAGTADAIRNAWVSSTGVAFAVGADGVGFIDCGSGSVTITAGTEVWGSAGGGFQSDTTVGHSLLNDVWGSSATNVYAVGQTAASPCDLTSSPLVRHFNGADWSTITPPAGAAGLQRIWGVSATEIYVMGFGGTFYRYNGSTWTPLPSTPVFCPSVMDMTGVGGNVFVTCLTDKQVYRFDGSAWVLHGSPHFAMFGSRMRMLALAMDDIFVVGSDAAGTGTISHYQGMTPQPVRSVGESINDVWGTPKRIFWVDTGGVHSIMRAVPW